MNNLFTKIQKFKTRTNLIILVIIILAVFAINTISNSIKKQSQISTEPVISPVISTTPTLSRPLPTPTLSISWNSIASPQLPDSLYEFPVVSTLASSDTLNTLPSLLGFTNTQKVNISDKNVSVWSNNKHSLSINSKENSLVYATSAAPTSKGPSFSAGDSLLAGHNLIKKLFGDTVESSLIEQEVSYFKSYSIYSSPSTVDQADLVRISFYQSINGYPVLSRSETGAVFTLFFDRNLNLYSFSIVGGFYSIGQGQVLTIYPFSDATKYTNNAQRLNSSPDLATNFQTASSKKINLSVNKTNIGYLQIQNSYLPIYIIEGNLTGDASPQQSGIYAFPASK